ncbi:MAG: ATP-grasp domain-containing protein [Clostridia bacterium]|nr:ATP-grasp domain-containing protein [Clostridia bacterium]
MNYVAEKLGLTCNPPEIMEPCTNKYAMRKCFLDAGIPSPQFVKTDSVNDRVKAMAFPLIVKPTDRSGSRSITKVYEKKGLQNAIDRAVRESFENMAIVEEYIAGDEYSLESISYRGEHHFLAITKKYTTGEPHFIETGHVQPADLTPETEKEVEKVIFSALDALGVQNGAGHAEFRVDEKGNVRIIEIGARMGGDCIGSDLVQLSTGYDFVKMVIDVACGKKPDFTKGETVERAEIRFLFGEEDLQELKQIQKENPNRIHFVSEIEKSDAVQDSSTRWGYYILID